MTPQRKMLIRVDREADVQRWRQALRRASGAPAAAPAVSAAPAPDPQVADARVGGTGDGEDSGSDAGDSCAAVVMGGDEAADSADIGGPEIVLKEGVLVKRGTWPHTWRKRHFRLVRRGKRHIVLEYRGEAGEEEARGFVHLAGAAILPVDAPGRSHTFAVTTTERELLLEATSNEEMDAWANTLQHAAIVAAGGFAGAGEEPGIASLPSASADAQGGTGPGAATAEGGKDEGEAAGAVDGGRSEGEEEGAKGEADDGARPDEGEGESKGGGEGDGARLDEGEEDESKDEGEAESKDESKDGGGLSPASPELSPSEARRDVEDVTVPLHVGAVLWKKMGNESKYNGPRYLWVPYEGREIRWTKGTQPHPTKSKSMPLDQVRAVRVGRPSKLAKKELKSMEDPGEVCFTLVHAQAKRSLDVRAADSGQLKQWVAGLRALLGSAGGGEARA